MKTQILIASGVVLAALVNFTAPTPAQAKTEKQCIAEWNQMKAAKQTAGKKRKDFIAQCRGTAATAPAPTPSTTTTTKPPAKTGRVAPPPVATGRVVFPSAVSPKYSSESAGRARMHTCRDQYNANKATGGNGGLKWIQKGDGYYSECNKHLKGQG
jgi:hypothetical protein